MKSLLITFSALLAMSGTAFGDDITITFSPATESYPPGADTATCEATGVAPCVVFAGTITDNDTDGTADNPNLIYLTGITLSAYSEYFTVDNTFSSDVPGAFEGDSDDYVTINTYSGPIMGLDIAPDTPVGTYTAEAVFEGAGGDGDPDYNGFTEDVSFTVDVLAPEPATGGLLLAGLFVALAASRRLRRPRTC